MALGADGKRSDGRSALQQQLPTLKAGVFGNAKGSSFAEAGDTRVMCAVYGPRQITTDFDELCRIRVTWTVCSFAEQQYNDAPHHYDRLTPEDRSKVLLVEQALSNTVLTDQYPKTVIDVHFVIAQRGAAVLPLAIVAGGLALADAGIALRDVVTAAHASCCKTDGGEHTPIIDPTVAERAQCGNSVVVAYLAASERVVAVSHEGAVPASAAESAVKLCVSACTALRPVLRKTLSERHGALAEEQQAEDFGTKLSDGGDVEMR
eukprot:TRINITY_DN608_c1_g1_i2.p1 TRINITY_DN608_c1_g1~~TRINITY_DN608_c1_g1_i2.p1  ORF type:complete len:263 (+),score=47.78 TRINITY_DN608_c1_g1_i2:84-872(+)